MVGKILLQALMVPAKEEGQGDLIRVCQVIEVDNYVDNFLQSPNQCLKCHLLIMVS